MYFQLIRSATVRIEYAGHLFVFDPYLAAKHSQPSWGGKSPNPLVELPCSPEEVLAGVEAVFISHLHADHFDPTAQQLLPKEVPLICQPEDIQELTSKGFVNLHPVVGTVTWGDVKVIRTICQHGSGEVLKAMGNTSGFILQAPNEPTFYWAGDTVLCQPVIDVINSYQPEVIVTHSRGAVWGDHTLIVMDAAQTIQICRLAPESYVIATHMDSVDHATITRKALREYANTSGINSTQLLIPRDGEHLILD